MKKLISILTTLLIGSAIIAQPYGNEWINYDQKYLKFKVSENGVYKIRYTDLEGALDDIGEDIDVINPQNIQIYGRGVEIPIYIDGEGDGVFDTDDFIEFFAERNTGWLDSLIYDLPENQNNPYVSLFNDTSAYFLTINSSVNNKRFESVSAPATFPTNPINYIIKKDVQYNSSFSSNQHWKGVYDSNNKHDVEFTKGEGWFFSAITTGTQTYTFNTSQIYSGSGAPDARIETVVAGVNNPNGNLDHHIELLYNNGTPFFSENFESFDMFKATTSIASSSFLSSTSIQFRHGNLGNINARSAMSYIKYTYPHKLDLESADKFEFYLPNQGFDNYLNLANVSNAFPTFIYDFEEQKRIECTAVGNNVKAIVPQSSQEKKCYLFATNTINDITGFQPVGANGQFRQFLTQQPSDAFVVVSHDALWDKATEYTAYRNSFQGGGHDTLMANIEHLYDQFAYGINKHPLAIKHFADYLIDSLTTIPSNLFLIGKSVTYVSAHSGLGYNQNLVPTFGYPSSDNLFTVGLNNSQFEFEIPTGRLSALDANDVDTYLEKVIELEQEQNTPSASIASKEWMKNVVHFGGGNGVSQQGQFAVYLNAYKTIIEDTLFGGNVNSVFKNSAAIISPDLSDTIKSWIEEGVSLITFFGHSSAQGFDVSLDDPNFYDNKDKYPVFLANGCQSGNTHLVITSQVRSSSEQFVFAEEAGAIAFIAATDLGIASTLHPYSTEFYKNVSYKNYGSSIGEILKATVQEYQQNGSSFAVKSTCHEMSIQGDPALKINSHELPDFATDNEHISVTPENVSTADASFLLEIEILNLGRTSPDSVPITVQHFKPNGEDSTYLFVLPPVLFTNTVAINIPTTGAGGQNYFNISIDPNNGIQESHTSNNFVFQYPLWISSSDLIPVFPYNYAVVPTQNITLKASTADPFAPDRTYKIQIDRKDTYDSNGGNPLDEITLSRSGGVVSWTPNLGSVQDSAVFYWRCSPTETINWKEHSFQYIANKTGWGQDDFFQFKNDEIRSIDHNRATEKFEFEPSTAHLYCQTVGGANNVSDFFATRFSLNNEQAGGGVCGGNPGIYVAVFDSLTLQPWGTYYDDGNGNIQNPNNDFGDYYSNGSCWSGATVDHYFVFRQDIPGQLDSLRNMLLNVVPDGNYILAYTAVRGDFQTNWQSTHFDAFEQLGATQISNLTNDQPYIFFTKKGDNSTTQEAFGNANTTLAFAADMVSNQPKGSIKSTLIGPSNSWGSLHWKHYDDTPQNSDLVAITIIGIDDQGQETILDTITEQQGDILELDTIINATQYPYLRLQIDLEDFTNFSSGQMDRWHVLFEGIPEAALNQSTAFVFGPDTIQQGQKLAFAVPIENVSLYDMDSLRVSYWVVDQYGTRTDIVYNKQAPLISGTTLLDTIQFSSLGASSGANDIWIEVNPIDSEWQLEQYHFNNIAHKSFAVQRDNTNPILDVIFDGIHILDGDIVSPTPSILIELKDENKFVALSDTSSFEIIITDSEGIASRIAMNSPEISFTEGQLPENKARVELAPKFARDGIYTLTVQGTDGSGNKAGDFVYKISFEVITASSITNLINYPNPFTTKTQFVFVLTGSQIPEELKIQILTVSGKVVKEISKAELGSIRIGRNITDYYWDGTDNYGDYLANGVYLYRVVTQLEGENMEHRSTNADQFFHKGFGKMYLMR